MQNIKKLSNLLTSKERFRTMLLLVMVLIMAFIEMLGIASIMPFIAVMSNPELVETNTYLNSGFKLASNFAIETKNRFLFTLGIFYLIKKYDFFKKILLYSICFTFIVVLSDSIFQYIFRENIFNYPIYRYGGK